MTQPPQPQLQKHRYSSCNRHPSKSITGFCASCLRERLAGIDPDTHQETPATHLAAELRRSKSYSSTTNNNLNNNNASSTSTSSTTATTSEPRRISCDVRQVRNTLSELFHVDDKRINPSVQKPKCLDSGLELKEEEDFGEISVLALDANDIGRNVDDFEEDGELKTMKEFIDLEWERKKNGGRDLKYIAGSFWEVASVLSKKLGRWQRKQKKKEKKDGGNLGGLVRNEMLSVRNLRETQSEIGEYGLGRRSCDTDPRLSVDVARLSVDDSRYSFDDPRASWDGYLIGKTYPRQTPLVSVMEDVKLPSGVAGNVKENMDLKNEGESSPGGTMQTRNYYSDRRRRSFDRSSSNRRVGLGDEEFKSMLNAKVSPETVGLFHGAKLLVTEKELRDSNWYSHKDYGEKNVDAVSKDVTSITGVGVSKKGFKKPQRWYGVWNIWGLMQKSSQSKCGDEGSSISGSAVDGPMPESWQNLSGVADGEANGIVTPRLIRSYTVSARDSGQMAGSTSGAESKENGMKRKEELSLKRNRSARYSPNHLDNGLLRFYLAPLRSYGRSKSGKSGLKNSSSMSRNVL
ncbi:hypothetical protein OIU77_017019 [Salix suchowensis]|uniref:Uncharacterized protein n=1 Tax=Salix suchowensis TaxID=1278906 RepID=A0ABQ8ZMI0_9ROSI|nr:UPF0503 protein [Salix suchowensis]KAJ6303056.1 hypothetical protein OIU77_017019 [Salix suchowensis]KAJ6315673.1 hypothetical protein OIU78_019026 [Salix suchowensis]